MRSKFLLVHLIGWVGLLMLTACASDEIPRVASLGGPRVWLDQPLDGATLPLGAHTLKAHARDTGGGVARIAFWVNGTPLGEVATDTSAELVYAETSWNPSVPGEYVIVAVAQNAVGARTESAPARVCIGANCPGASPVTPTRPPTVPPSVTASPTVPPVTLTPSPTVRPAITPTRTPTVRPSVTPSRTNTPQVGCSGTPTIASFTASPTTITAGQSATLSWGLVSNADSVEITPGIGGVGTPGSVNVTPGSTTTYTLIARCGQNVATRTVTINVTQPPTSTQPPQDTTPPNIANLAGSPNPVYHTTGCGNTTLTVTVNVSDPSGVANVTLNYAFADSKGNVLSPSFTRAMSASGGNNYQTTINVPNESWQYLNNQNYGRVNLYVTARDNLGNTATSNTIFVQTWLCVP